MLQKSVFESIDGWCAEVYDAERNMVGKWYGTQAECRAIDPHAVHLYPLTFSNPAEEFDVKFEHELLELAGDSPDAQKFVTKILAARAVQGQTPKLIDVQDSEW